MSGRIILCADDYAMTAGISRAIRMLAAAGRISATSAIVTLPSWSREAAALKELAGGLAVGLHLNLTHGRPLDERGAGMAMPGLRRRIAAAYSGRLAADELRTEIAAQLNVYESCFGRPPDFIDGHEHVHVLPGVRAALLDVARTRFAGRPLLIRDPSPTIGSLAGQSRPWVKTAALKVLARNLRRDVEASGFVSNDGFSGVSNFSSKPERVAADFDAAARVEGWRPIVMCHPGFADSESVSLDPLAARRQAEFDALMSADPPISNIWRPVRGPDGFIQWPAAGMRNLA